MIIHSLNHASENVYLNDRLVTRKRLDWNEMEAIKGLRSIIKLSMHCLQVILRHGHSQGGLDRDVLIQDSDPYLESLMNMVRQGTTKKV